MFRDLCSIPPPQTKKSEHHQGGRYSSNLIFGKVYVNCWILLDIAGIFASPPSTGHQHSAFFGGTHQLAPGSSHAHRTAVAVKRRKGSKPWLSSTWMAGGLAPLITRKRTHQKFKHQTMLVMGFFTNLIDCYLLDKSLY